MLESIASSLGGQILLIALGGVGVWMGAEVMVGGASRLAKRFGISEFLIGATIIAFGTSAPEWIVSFMAHLEGKAAISLGNVIGSNVANIAMVLGLTGLFVAIRVGARTLSRELTLVLLAEAAFTWMCWDRALDWLDGVLLLAGFLAIYTWILLGARRSTTQLEMVTPEELDDSEAKLSRDSALTLIGLLLLLIGARFFVVGAEYFALEIGMSEETVGLTIVAVGTSLPELGTSLVAALRGRADMSLGNLLGSNLFNVLLVGGSLAVVDTVPVAASIDADLLWMLGVSAVLFPLALLGRRVQDEGGRAYLLVRGSGLVLALAYATYIGLKVREVIS